MSASGTAFSPQVLQDAKSPGSGPAKRSTLSTGVIPQISLGPLTCLRTWLIWKKRAQHEAGPSPLSLAMTLQSLSASSGSTKTHFPPCPYASQHEWSYPPAARWALLFPETRDLAAGMLSGGTLQIPAGPSALRAPRACQTTS